MTLRIKAGAFWLTGAALIGLAATLLFWGASATATEAGSAGTALSSGAIQWGFVAAALATGLSSLGAGIAVASVGSAAIGAMAEKPELLGRALIMVGLAEGIAIYGLIISILILNRIL
jgi:V/A-type H+/Na+-transporting ATPase subunit K